MMMDIPARKKLRNATLVYWFLLLYVVAALIWWFITLTQQSHLMSELKIQQLQTTVDNATHSPTYQDQLNKIIDEKKRAERKYISEGITFLLLMLVGAFFVYRSVKKQIKLQQQQQNFTMEVTHELKTPIAVVQLNLETLQKHQLDKEKQQKLIYTMLQETNRLNTLINNILVSSQLEGGKYHRAEEDLNLSALSNSAIEDFKHRFTDRTWQANIEPDINIHGDPLLLKIMINNLLENAIKYSPKQQPVSIQLYKADNRAILEVKDWGIGVANEEKIKIFEKFYRSENEQTRKTKGTGLGLYLCKKIAADHYADIDVTDNTPSGSIFIVTFYRLT